MESYKMTHKYKCQCGEVYEMWTKNLQEPLNKICPKCKSNKSSKLITAPELDKNAINKLTEK